MTPLRGTRLAAAHAAASRDTARLSLRRPTLDDLDDLFEIHSDPAAALHSPTGPQTPTRRVAHQMLTRWLADWATHGIGYWTVRLAGAEQIIGFGGVSCRQVKEFDKDLVANLYYRFRPSAWGHGYATEMAREAKTVAAEVAPRLRLVAFVRPDNVPSARVAENVGLCHALTVERDGVPMRVYLPTEP